MDGWGSVRVLGKLCPNLSPIFIPKNKMRELNVLSDDDAVIVVVGRNVPGYGGNSPCVFITSLGRPL
jgi:hypothetical protein